MKRVYVNEEWRLGCRLCEYNCAFALERALTESSRVLIVGAGLIGLKCAEGILDRVESVTVCVLAILPNAYTEGRTAGINMAGGDDRFDCAIPMNSVGFFGFHIMTAGSYDGEMTEEREEGSVRRFFTKDGCLIGFIIIGDTVRAGIYTDLIRKKTPLSTVDFDFAKKNASNLIFSPEIRRKRFGGVV